MEGVFVNNTSTDCDLANTNFANQCLKCADLSIILAGNGPQVDASLDLIGNTTDNVFTVCDSDNPAASFNALLDVQDNAEGTIEGGFARMSSERKCHHHHHH